MNQRFPNLFSEIALGPCLIPNRIVSTGHHTYLCDDRPDEHLIAYHEARARGGAGLIVSEIVAVHETAEFSHKLLKAYDRAAIPDYANLAGACHRHGTRLFAQLFHPGREIISSRSGMQPVAWAPSAVPTERFHIMPRAMPVSLIREIVAGFATAAENLAAAGFDGFEIVASHGYLPAQFLNPRSNLRQDDYGGDFDRRLTFLREVIAAVRDAAGGLAVGVRLSATETEAEGLTGPATVTVCEALAGDIDYISVVVGTSASISGSVHIVPPMGLEHAYVAPFAATIKAAVPVPVMVTGRINQPQLAEQLIARGDADLCGMTRAMICDPAMPSKARAGDLDDIRACIGCNQACIGRAHKGLGISCIQFPESGRELTYAGPLPASSKRVLVAGGGPAGMKAAAVAAARGHSVTLYESGPQLGGQANLAQRLPGREEFGGIVGNLSREMTRAGVEVITGTALTGSLVRDARPDAVILATGARPYAPALEGLDSSQVVTAWDVLENRANLGTSVAIADWRGDWIGLGLAERLARAGFAVTLCVNAEMAGAMLQAYTRNHYVARLHKLEVRILTHVRPFSFDETTAYFQDTLSEAPVILENVDTLVLATGHRADDSLHGELESEAVECIAIGDCLAPRTAEEAVYEGLRAGWTL